MTTPKSKAKAKPASDAVAEFPVTNPDAVGTPNFFAGVFELTKRRFSQLAKERSWEKLGHGRYSIKGVISDFVAMREEQAKESIRGLRGSGDYETERTRLTSAQADRAEVELAKMASNLIPIERAERIWTDIAVKVRTRLLAIPSKTAPELADIGDPREIRAYLDEMIAEVLGELVEEVDLTKDPEAADRYFEPEGE